MKRGIFLTAAAATLALACTDSPAGPRAKVTLSASQAATIVSRAQLIAASRSDLAWLGDSINVVLKEGAEARLVTVSVDGVNQNYYAVGLTRQFSGANPFSTFQLIGFDDPDNPSSFAVASGYAAGTDSTPPSSAVGTFGDGKVFAHLVRISGATVTDMEAIQGDAAFVLGDLGVGCVAMQATCNAAPLVVDFASLVVQPDNNPAQSHAVTHIHVVAPGIVLRY